MNGKEFIKAVKLITEEKGISEDVVFEGMEQALITAYKKNFKKQTNVKVEIDRKTGDIKVFRYYVVVDSEGRIAYAVVMPNNGYGGPNGNVGGETTNSYITVKSLRTGATSIYGGGLNAKVTKSEITTSPSKTDKYSQDEDRYLATTIYGGSKVVTEEGATQTEINTLRSNSKVGTVKITVNDGGNLNTAIGVADVLNIYGGGNNVEVGKADIVVNNYTSPKTYLEEDDVIITSKDYMNIYGGSKSGGTTGEVNITVNKGSVNTIYGGGYKSTVEKSNITILGGSISRINGGGNVGIVNDPNILVAQGETSPYVGTIYGSMNDRDEESGSTMPRSSVIVNGGTVSNLYGGGYKSLLKDSNVTILKGNVNNLYGGSREKSMPNGATINVNVIAGKVPLIVGGSYIVEETDALDNVQTNINIGKNIAIQTIELDEKHKAYVESAAGVALANIPIPDPTLGTTLPGVYASLLIDNIYTTTSYIVDPDAAPIENYLFVGNKTTDESIVSRLNIDATGYERAELTINKTITGAGIWLENTGRVDLNIKDWGEKYTSKETNQSGFIHTLASIERFTNVNMHNAHIELTGNSLIEVKDDLYAMDRISSLNIAGGTSLYFEKQVNRIGALNSLKKYDFEKTVEENLDSSNYQTVGTVATELPVKNNPDVKHTYYYLTPDAISGMHNRIFTIDDLDLVFAKTPQPWIFAGKTGTDRDFKYFNPITGAEERHPLVWSEIRGMTYWGQFAYNRALAGAVLTNIYNPNLEEALNDSILGFYKARTYPTAANVNVKVNNVDRDYLVDGFYTNVPVYEDEYSEELKGPGQDQIADGIASIDVVVMEETSHDAGNASIWAQKEPDFKVEVDDDEEEEVNADTKIFILRPHQSDSFTMKSINLRQILGLPVGTDMSGLTVSIGTTINTFKPGLELVDPNTIPFMSQTPAGQKYGLEIIPEYGFIDGGKDNYRWIQASGTAQTATIENGDPYFTIDDSGKDPIIKIKLSCANNIQDANDAGSIMVRFGVTLNDGTILEKALNLAIRKEVIDNKETYSVRFKDYEGAEENNLYNEQYFTRDSEVELRAIFYNAYNSNLETSTEDKKVITFNPGLPAGTKITLIQYYSTSDSDLNYTYGSLDDTRRTRKFYYKASGGETQVDLTAFIEEGTVSNHFSWNSNKDVYGGTRAEKYDILIDFENAIISSDMRFQVGMSRLRGDTGVARWGTENPAVINIMSGDEDLAQIDIRNDGSLSKDTIELADSTNTSIKLITSIVEQETASGKKIIDTKTRDKNIGIVAELVRDSNRVALSNATTLNGSGEVVGGAIREKLSEFGIGGITDTYDINFSDKEMLFGDYNLRFSAFASDDGKLYDSTDRKKILEFPIHIDGKIGLTGKIPTNDRIIRLDEGRNTVEFDVTTDRKPEEGYVTVVLSKRNSTYSNGEYQPVRYSTYDLNRIITNDFTLAETVRAEEGVDLTGIFENKEYFIGSEFSANSGEFTIDFNLNLVENISDIPTGEYKFTFKVYSKENNLLETSEKTIVVVK